MSRPWQRNCDIVGSLHYFTNMVHQVPLRIYLMMNWELNRIVMSLLFQGLNVFNMDIGVVTKYQEIGPSNPSDLYWNLVNCGITVKLSLVDLSWCWGHLNWTGSKSYERYIIFFLDMNCSLHIWWGYILPPFILNYEYILLSLICFITDPGACEWAGTRAVTGSMHHYWLLYLSGCMPDGIIICQVPHTTMFILRN